MDLREKSETGGANMWRYIPGRRKPHDSWAYILYVDEARRRVQLIGDRYFIMMEFVLKTNVSISPMEKVYVGKGPRKEVSRFLRYMNYEELAPSGKMLLETVVLKILQEGEGFFVNLFNESGPITPRLHQLELLPGVGKKTLMKILEERRKSPFASYSDVAERTGLKDPAELLVRRTLEELRGNEKYYIIVAPKSVLGEDII